MTAVFADHAFAIRSAGWTSVFPLPRNRKAPPPSGVTGARRYIPSGPDVQAWTEMYPGGNVAIGMPQGVDVDGRTFDVVGVDVDQYEKGGVVKSGLATIDRLQSDAGAEFPPTVKITSRGDDVSGKYLYRIPAGVELVGALPGVELLQHWHRYAVAPPSTNPDSGGSTFAWRTEARPDPGTLDGPPDPRAPGVRTDRIPRPTELPELPAPLVAALRRTGPRTQAVAVDPEMRKAFFREMPPGIDGIPCYAVRKRYRIAQTDLRASRHRGDHDGRHDTALRHVMGLMRLGHMGHLGVREALRHLRATFLDVTADRAEAAAAEWSRFLRPDAVGRILATPTDEVGRQCMCADGLAALFTASDHPEADAAAVGIHLPSVIAAIDHPTVRAVIAAKIGATQ